MPELESDFLASLARQLGTEQTVDELWQRVVEAAVVQIDGAAHAGITVLGKTSVATPVASDQLVRDIDEHQYATGQGPCLTAARQQQPVVRVDDLTTDERWPEFTAAISGLGIRSMLSFQLYTDADTIGALNIYAPDAGAFTEDSEHTGTLLAAHAAVAAAAQAKNSNLRVALQARDTIGQAKGILMERYKITAPQAFDLLIAASHKANRKLRDIADELTDSGEIVLG